jgi:hypothetical protein
MSKEIERLKRQIADSNAEAASLRMELGKQKLAGAFRAAGVPESMLRYAIDGAVKDGEVEFDEDGTPRQYGKLAIAGEKLAKDFVTRNPGFVRQPGEGSGPEGSGPVDTDTMNAEELAALGLSRRNEKERAVARNNQADEQAALRKARGEDASPLTQQVAEGLRKAGVQ